MSESTTDDTSDKTSETSSDSSESESESESESSSEESSGESTPKAAGSGDEATAERETAETSTTTSAADDESTATPEPPPQPTMTTTTDITDQTSAVVVTSDESAEPSFTLHLEDSSTDASATVVPPTVDVEHPAAAATDLQLTDEKAEPTVKDEKIARVIGQAKSDAVVVAKPELATNESEVHRVYQRTVVQQSQVSHSQYC